MTREGLQSKDSTDPATAQAVRAFLARLEGRFELLHAILYGSHARGDFRSDSDADVALVLADEPTGRMAETLAMADEAFDVLMATGIRISPLVVWESEWKHPERHPNPALLASIARDGVVFEIRTNNMTRNELIAAVPVHCYNGRRFFVRIAEIPEPWRSQFQHDLRGSAAPALPDEGVLAYAWDWDAWATGRWYGRGPVGLDTATD
jgi:predicted nucleotidyltransferase